MPNTPEPEKPTITFHLIKGPDFQSHHIDGAIGGIAANGRVSLSFFVERGAIPQSVTHEINDDGTLGKIISSTGKQGMVREIQTGIILDADSLRTLNQQLSNLLEKIDQDL